MPCVDIHCWAMCVDSGLHNSAVLKHGVGKPCSHTKLSLFANPVTNTLIKNFIRAGPVRAHSQLCQYRATQHEWGQCVSCPGRATQHGSYRPAHDNMYTYMRHTSEGGARCPFLECIVPVVQHVLIPFVEQEMAGSNTAIGRGNLWTLPPHTHTP